MCARLAAAQRPPRIWTAVPIRTPRSCEGSSQGTTCVLRMQFRTLTMRVSFKGEERKQRGHKG